MYVRTPDAQGPETRTCRVPGVGVRGVTIESTCASDSPSKVPRTGVRDGQCRRWGVAGRWVGIEELERAGAKGVDN